MTSFALQPRVPWVYQSRSNHPTASGGQKASLNRAKDTSATSTPSTEGDRQEGGQLRPTRDRMPAREKDSCSRAGDAPLTSPLSASRTPRVRPPRPASPSPPGNESLLNGTSTARTPTGAAGSAGTPGGVGSVPPRIAGSPAPWPPQAQRSHERIQGQTFRGKTSGGQLPGGNFRGPIRGIISG